MFKLFLEGIVKTKLLTYLIILAAFLAFSNLNFITVLAGMALVSLIEYLMHRFLFHALPRRFGKYLSKRTRKILTHGHIFHHRSPENRQDLFLPLWMSASLILLLSILTALIANSLTHGISLATGLIVGYVWYEFMHLSAHHGASSARYLQFMKNWHERHHRTKNGSCYGVTSPVWDCVFRTHRTTRRG